MYQSSFYEKRIFNSSRFIHPNKSSKPISNTKKVNENQNSGHVVSVSYDTKKSENTLPNESKPQQIPLPLNNKLATGSPTESKSQILLPVHDSKETVQKKNVENSLTNMDTIISRIDKIEKFLYSDDNKVNVNYVIDTLIDKLNEMKQDRTILEQQNNLDYEYMYDEDTIRKILEKKPETIDCLVSQNDKMPLEMIASNNTAIEITTVKQSTTTVDESTPIETTTIEDIKTNLEHTPTETTTAEKNTTNEEDTTVKNEQDTCVKETTTNEEDTTVEQAKTACVEENTPVETTTSVETTTNEEDTTVEETETACVEENTPVETTTNEEDTTVEETKTACVEENTPVETTTSVETTTNEEDTTVEETKTACVEENTPVETTTASEATKEYENSSAYWYLKDYRKFDKPTNYYTFTNAEASTVHEDFEENYDEIVQQGKKIVSNMLEKYEKEIKDCQVIE